MSKEIFLPSGVNYSSITWTDHTTGLGNPYTRGFVSLHSTVQPVTIAHPQSPARMDARFEFGRKTGIGSPLTHPIRALLSRLVVLWPTGCLKTFEGLGIWFITPVSAHYPRSITDLMNEGLNDYRKAMATQVMSPPQAEQGTLPIQVEQWGDLIHIDGVCRCDIKDLLSTGHNSSCPEKR